MRYVQDDFVFCEPEVVELECEKCGNIITDFYDYAEVEECDECGCDTFINTTNIENTSCEMCGIGFDMWQNYYEHANTGICICEECYEKLPETLPETPLKSSISWD